LEGIKRTYDTLVLKKY